MKNVIRRPHATQHEESFRRVADEGATIVSGSQAHFPHIMEFRDDSFIHYGLGNLFFDQMTYILPSGEVIDETRREFYDRHVFYDGRYIGTELLTAMLEDYSRPRPMTEAERAAFLSDYFYYSGWNSSGADGCSHANGHTYSDCVAVTI